MVKQYMNRIVLRNRYGKMYGIFLLNAPKCTEFVRDRYGIGAEYVRNTHGIHTVFTENIRNSFFPYVFRTNFTFAHHVIHTGNVREKQILYVFCKNHVYSVCVLYAFHTYLEIGTINCLTMLQI